MRSFCRGKGVDLRCDRRSNGIEAKKRKLYECASDATGVSE